MFTVSAVFTHAILLWHGRFWSMGTPLRPPPLHTIKDGWDWEGEVGKSYSYRLNSLKGSVREFKGYSGDTRSLNYRP